LKAAREGHPEAVEKLLKKGAQTDIPNYDHLTARNTTLDGRVDELLNKH
jgi:hypothetical protein